MNTDELANQLIPLMDNWSEEKKAEFAKTLQGILRDKPSDPSQFDAWADEGKRKFLAELLDDPSILQQTGNNA